VPEKPPPEKPAREKPAPAVYTLLVEVGRKPEDGLPDGATGAGLLCYAMARTEDEAVRETVEVLKTAGLNPLEVQSYGAAAEREAAGEDIAPEERALMDRAAAENAVVVAQVTHFFD
jgi:hypothetical protein